MKIPDAPFAAFIFFSKIISSCVKAFSYHPWMIYCSSILSVFGGASSPIARSILSKSVPQEDLGKVFSLTASLEALTPLAASPLYSLLFENTLNYFSGAIYLLSAAIFFLDFILMSIVGLTELKYSREDTQAINNDEEAN
ncbi:hypothetical protein J437_LFUL008868 [Ladona fulva]|uniref:Solute carrier family 46 member 3 n=1 Tax=Ladona fulva TaxID=123851 RepID=A0A8K0P4F3_LADFU|nr:hypothetical protein J437_LFUL008868 [Ladona fulva]